MDEKDMLDNEGPTRGYEEDRQRMRPDDEGSTRHPSGKNIDTQDTQRFMGGGSVKQGYMDGGEVRRGDVRDNSKRGKCY
jgi:hypothetical protein